MMKKYKLIMSCTVFCLVASLPVVLSAEARWTPTYSISGTSAEFVAQGGASAANAEGYLAFYTNPAGLVLKDEVINYSLDTWFTSDTSTLGLLASPASEVEALARRIAETVSSMSLSEAKEFWGNNQALMSRLYELDASFPTITAGEAINDYTVYEIEQYFQNRFTQSDYGAARWGQAVVAFANQSNFFESIVSDPRQWFGGNFKLGLSMGTSRINGGFGWAFGFAAEYRTGGSLLGKQGGKLDISFSFPLGYAFQVSPQISLGVGLRAEIRINTAIPDSNFLNARFQNDVLSLFSEPFNFGAGFGLDFGMNYQPAEALRFALVVRNLPALQHYVYTPLADLAGLASGKWPEFVDDPNIYFVPTDIAIGGMYRFTGVGGYAYTLNLEVSDVLSQFIWNQHYPTRKFVVDDVFKVGLDIELNETVRLMLGYANQFLSFGVMGNTSAGRYCASVSARILRFEAGPSIGVNFRMAF